MVVSEGACLAAGFLFGSSVFPVVPFVLLWGFVIVADSAQFSAAVSELAEESYVGTTLTLQIAIDFLLTTISIQLILIVVDLVGWPWAFTTLALGPAVGTLPMLRLRGLPSASKLASGRK